MNIACVANAWFPETPGGLERYSHGLAEQLVQNGDKVQFFCTGQPHMQNPNFYGHSLGTSNASLLRRIRNARACFKQHWPNQVDIINLHFALYALPALEFADPQTPIVCNFQGPWAAESSLEGDGRISTIVKYWIEKCVYRKCNRFIVLSEAFKRILQDSYGVSGDVIDVIRCGIDATRFAPSASRSDARKRLGWPQDRFILFTVRRLITRMGLRELILGMQLLKDGHCDVWLAIAGRGPLETTLKQLIEELGLRDYVHIVGYVTDDDLVLSYQAADLTVVPSQQLEGLGYLIPESLACGTPVIATPVGGMPEVLKPLQGTLITSGVDPKSIASSLQSFADGDFQLPTQNQCRNYAVENFAWPTIMQKVRKVFEEA